MHSSFLKNPYNKAFKKVQWKGFEKKEAQIAKIQAIKNT